MIMDQQASRPWLGVRKQQAKQPYRMPTMSATAARINEYVSIYLSILCLLLLLQLQLQSYVCPFVCFAPQQFSINNIDMSSINIYVTVTSFPPSATGISYQQLQPEGDPTMAMAIMTHRQQHSSGMQTSNRKMGHEQPAWPWPPAIYKMGSLHQHGCVGKWRDGKTRRQCREGKDVWLIQRGEGHVDDEDRGWTQGCQWSW